MISKFSADLSAFSLAVMPMRLGEPAKSELFFYAQGTSKKLIP